MFRRREAANRWIERRPRGYWNATAMAPNTVLSSSWKTRRASILRAIARKRNEKKSAKADGQSDPAFLFDARKQIPVSQKSTEK